MTAEEPVRKALDAYARAVFGRLRDAEFVLPPKEARGSGWVASGDAFVQREYQEWQHRLRRSVEVMGETSEHKNALAALRNHPVIGARVDAMVGGWTLNADDVPAMLLREMVSEVDGLALDEAVFDRAFGRLYAWLVRDEEAVVVVAPLSGLAADEVPIPLAPNIEIDRMTDEEVIACLTTRMVSGFGAGTLVHVDPRLALRIRERHPVDEGFMSEDPLRGRIEPINAVTHALRLLKAGKVHVPGFVDMPEAPYQRGYRFTPISALPHRPFTTYTLHADDAQHLAAVWAGLRDEKVLARTPLVTAIRRFGYAGERSRTDDQLLDLVIAAEAIFLYGDMAENKHKLSMRAALFAEDPRRSPVEVARFFRNAYDLRSKFAHGGEVTRLKPIDGEPATLEQYAQTVADYLRAALRRMIEMAARGDPLPLDDWDEFTFGRLLPDTNDDP